MCCAVAVPSGGVVEVLIRRSIHCKPHLLRNRLVVREKRGKGDVQRERHTAEKICYEIKDLDLFLYLLSKVQKLTLRS